MWISPFTTVLDSYLLKLSRGYVAQGSLASTRVDGITSKVEVTTLDGAQVKLHKVYLGKLLNFCKLNIREKSVFGTINVPNNLNISHII